MHSPLTSPSPKTSLPPTTKNRLRSEIDAKATTNVVGNYFAGVPAVVRVVCGSHMNCKYSSFQTKTKIDVASHPKNSGRTRVRCFASIGRHHTLNAATVIRVVEVTMV